MDDSPVAEGMKLVAPLGRLAPVTLGTYPPSAPMVPVRWQTLELATAVGTALSSDGCPGGTVDGPLASVE